MNTTVAPLRFATLAFPGSRSSPDLAVDLARSRHDRQCALELHRDVYCRKGLLQKDSLKPRVLPQACAPGSAIFVAKVHGAVVGTITFYMDSAIGLPMDDVHGKEVDRMRSRFARVGEVGGLAILERRRGVGITTMLYLATLRWAIAANAQCLVACVNPSSRRVYSKLLLFEVLGGCKPHPRFLGAPSIPIGLDLATAPIRYRTEHGDELDHYLPKPSVDIHPACTSTGHGSAQFLQWSDDEVSEMIESKRLALTAEDQVFLERHYWSKPVAGGSG
jgi:GNAT superfamily N-acetyltransferase